MFGTVLLRSGTASAPAATISRSVDVKAPARDAGSLIGPFGAIKDWLPPLGQCIEDGKARSTPGQEKAASEALLGVYEAGLAEIQARFAK
jgi:hypothetical protein